MRNLVTSSPVHTSWRALGTDVRLHVVDPVELERATKRAQSILDEVDQACSRFRSDSDLVRANSRPGRWTRVSPVLVAAISVALQAARVTDGRVDPTLGLALEAAGYDRSFELLGAATGQPSALPAQLRPGAWREVALDGDRVQVPVGVRLDLGATGKSFAADLVAADLAARLSGALAVSVGGDVAVARPDGCAPHWWKVVVAETPTDLEQQPQDTTTVHVAEGGVATSTVRARHWTRGGRDWHHVLDPRNGLPVGGPWRSASALGHTCSAANTATTAALVLGVAATAWLADRDVAALLVDEDGRRHATPRWNRATAASASAKEDSP